MRNRVSTCYLFGAVAVCNEQIHIYFIGQKSWRNVINVVLFRLCVGVDIGSYDVSSVISKQCYKTCVWVWINSYIADIFGQSSLCVLRLPSRAIIGAPCSDLMFAVLYSYLFKLLILVAYHITHRYTNQLLGCNRNYITNAVMHS